MEYVVGALCMLTAVTLIGHGLWVVVASLFGGGRPRTGQTSACPRCGLPMAGEVCGVCRWPVAAPSERPAERSALAALQLQVDKLSELGVLSVTMRKRLAESLASELEQVELASHRAATESAASAPIVQPDASEPLVAEAVDEPAAVPAMPHAPAEHKSREAAVHDWVAAHVGRPERPFESQRAPRVAPQAPPEPARSWTDWLAAFMEQRNIRWGELVGGMLIVGCSIALVISFWAEIAARPWLKFLLFNGVTAAIFGVGFYSEHRWRLRTTSQGLLIIGSLLVPLNFLAIAALSSAPGSDGWLTIAGEIVSAGLFGTLVYFAGRILIGRDEALLTAGLLVPSLAQLLVRRFVDPAADAATLVAMAALPVVCYVFVNLWHLRRASTELVPSEARVNALFNFLGMTSFAAALPLALLLFKSGAPLEALRRLPALGGLLGIVPLSAGLMLWQKLAGRRMEGLRTAALSVAVLGAALTLAGLVVGWPQPSAMLPSAVLAFAVFSLVGWRYELPAAHVLAAPCLALAYLVGAHLLIGTEGIAWSGTPSQTMARALVSGETGVLLVPLVLAYLGAAFVALHRRASSHHWLAGAALGLMAASVALVSWFGFGYEGDPLGAGWVYLTYAACLLVIAARQANAAPAWLGSVLLAAGTLEIVMFRYGAVWGLAQPAITALLVFSTACAAIAILARTLRLATADSPLASVAWQASLTASLAAAAWLAWLIPAQLAVLEATHWAWLAAIWLAAAIATGRLPLWAWFQGALVLTVIFSTALRLAQEQWFLESPRRWLDPWTLEAIGAALVALNLGWALVRLVCRRFASAQPPDSLFARGQRILNSGWASVDRLTTAALATLLVALATYAALPGTLVELAPQGAARPVLADFELRAIPHAHAAGIGAWVLLAGLLVLVAVTLRERVSTFWLSCLLVVAALACPLLAFRFENELAVASALRWLSTGLLIAGSVAIWGRAWIARLAGWLGWSPRLGDTALLRDMTALVLLLGTLAPAVLCAAIGVQALQRAGQWPALSTGALVAALPWMVSLIGAAAIWSQSPGHWSHVLGKPRPDWPWGMASLVNVLGALPLVAVVVFQVTTALRSQPIAGVDAASLFARLGPAASYALPVAITGLVLAGYALGRAANGFALAGCLLLNSAATIALLALAAPQATFDAALWMRLAQLNAVVAAAFTILWAGLAAWRRRREGRYDAPAVDVAFAFQASIAPAVTILAFGAVWLELVRYPQGRGLDVVVPQLADRWSWLSFAAVCASIGVVAAVTWRRLSLFTINGLLLALVVLAAGVAARWDTGNWLAYHTMVVGHAAIAALMVAAAWQAHRAARGQLAASEPATAPRGAMWSVVQLLVLIGLALREIPANNWWAAGGLAYAGLVVAPALAWIFQRRRYLYLAVPLVNLAGLLAIEELNWVITDRELVYWNIVLVALPVVYWLAIELRSIRLRQFAVWWHAPGVHRVATRLALAVLVVMLGGALYGDALSHFAEPLALHLDWIALGATLVAAAACLWDPRARDAIAMLYVLGLAACGTLVDGFNLTPAWLLWTAAMTLAAYALLTSYLWSRRQGLAAIAQALRIPPAPQTELAGLAWLVPANLVLVAAVAATAFAVELTNEQLHLRVLAAQATLVQVWSVGMLARGDHRGLLQLVALKLGAVGAIFFGWAFLEVGSTLTLLNALVVVGAATAGVAAFYGLGLAKLLREASDWLAPARLLTPWLAATSVAALVATLGVEIAQYVRVGEVEMAWWAILIVAVTLAGLALAALAAAVLPGRDPLSLSERGRTLYVYGAEAILALLFAHIRVSMPWLFSGFLQQFWPLIAMAIAYLGVGVAEIFRRRNVRVLAEPLENTGALLPVLPVLGYWAGDTRVDYSLLLLCVGLLYGGLSIARRSFGFGVLAALAANGGLWFFLDRQQGWGFLAHPQVWLIPPAVCVLAAAYLNRRQLSDAQMTAVRYVCSMAIYLSSTADIFINGVAEAPWLPLVLGALSVAGILAGIALRVRAFLFLGTGFLALSLFTMIWYAAVDRDQTWIWWAAGIALGISIVALFAFFEKKRQDVLDVFERLKQWDA